MPIRRMPINVIRRAPPKDPHIFTYTDADGLVWSRDADDRWYRPGPAGEKIFYVEPAKAQAPAKPAVPAVETEKRAQQIVDEQLIKLKPRVAEASKPDVIKALELGAAWNGWGQYEATLAGRVGRAYPMLRKAVEANLIVLTPDLLGKLNETNSLVKEAQKPVQTAGTIEKAGKKASEALSELEHAANTIGSGDLAAPFVLGAKGPGWSPDQGDEVKAEVAHGPLPQIDVVNVEADGYYISKDGVLHLDEVKDTPRAAATKLKDGTQAKRQMEWLKRPVRDRPDLKKQVGYWIQATGPRFDDLLENAPLRSLDDVDKLQYRAGLPFIKIAAQSFTAAGLRKLYDDAVQWLKDSREGYVSRGMQVSEAAQTYFATLEKAQETLRNGPLQPAKM